MLSMLKEQQLPQNTLPSTSEGEDVDIGYAIEYKDKDIKIGNIGNQEIGSAYMYYCNTGRAILTLMSSDSQAWEILPSLGIS